MMNQTKKMMIVLILVAIFYYLYCIFPPSTRFPYLLTAYAPSVEGFVTKTSISSQTNINMPLSQYMIMGAYNATYNGRDMSGVQLEKILMTGARFIDLEIRSKNNLPILTTTNDSGSSTLSQNYVIFNDALTTILNVGFSTVENHMDPLFLHMRFILNEKDKASQFYCNVASNLYSIFTDDRLYSGIVNESTPLSQLQGKVVLCIDITTAPDYKDNQSCDPISTHVLGNMINIETRGSQWLTMDYTAVPGSPPIIVNGKNSCTITSSNNMPPSLQLLLPPPPKDPKDTYPKQKNLSPVDLNQFVVMRGCQTIPFMYFQTDTANNELSFYNQMFNDLKCAVVPMCDAINYIKKSYHTAAGKQTANYPPS